MVVLGGALWLLLSRYLSIKYHVSPQLLLQRFITSPRIQHQFIAIQRSVQQHSFKVSLLLQLTFLPLGVVTAVLGSWNINILSYIAATSISRTKVMNYIWLAMSVDDLRMLFSSQRPITPSDYVRLILGVFFSLTSLFVISFYARSQLRLMEEECVSHHIMNTGDDLDEMHC